MILLPRLTRTLSERLSDRALFRETREQARESTGLLRVAIKLRARTTHQLEGFRRQRGSELDTVRLWKDASGNFHDDLQRVSDELDLIFS